VIPSFASVFYLRKQDAQRAFRSSVNRRPLQDPRYEGGEHLEFSFLIQLLSWEHHSPRRGVMGRTRDILGRVRHAVNLNLLLTPPEPSVQSTPPPSRGR